MLSFQNYSVDVVQTELPIWRFSSNWPVVYIYYNEESAYVGETLDAMRRFTQHLSESTFKPFTHVCFISDKSFNKSVILDLESFLIKYISSEGSKKLINSNAGVVDHDYFYKDSYRDDFSEIWTKLIDIGIVQKSIQDIENSELFKFSPYKSLSPEQQVTTIQILRELFQANSKENVLIKITGGAGTGKTILAVYLLKLLININNQPSKFETEEFDEEVHFLLSKIKDINRIGFVVPQKALRDSMKTIFSSIEGFSPNMVLSAEDVGRSVINGFVKYDLLVVDEAHRLYQNKQLPSFQTCQNFKEINQVLMQEKYQGKETDYTELDWILLGSKKQIVFYDELQTIRNTDIPKERFDNIINNNLVKTIPLKTQMRCKAGTGWYDYVNDVLLNKPVRFNDRLSIDIQYEFGVCDSTDSLCKIINSKDQSLGLSCITTGPAWAKEQDIVIDEKTFRWKGSKNLNHCPEIYSIHKVQGFDLSYCGVIFGPEIYFDTEKGCISYHRNKITDPTMKGNDDVIFHYIRNIYLTLMTRGVFGTYVYAVDKDLQKYLCERFGTIIVD